MAKIKVLENTKVKIGKDVLHGTAFPQKGAVSYSNYNSVEFTKTGSSFEPLTGTTQYIEVSKDDATLMFLGSSIIRCNTKTATLIAVLDGKRVEDGRGTTNSTSYETVTFSAIARGVSKGRHKVELGWFAQDSNTVAYARAYAPKMISAWEI